MVFGSGLGLFSPYPTLAIHMLKPVLAFQWDIQSALLVPRFAILGGALVWHRLHVLIQLPDCSVDQAEERRGSPLSTPEEA